VKPRTALLCFSLAVSVAALASLVVGFWIDRESTRKSTGLDSVRAELRETRRELASMRRAQALLASRELGGAEATEQGGRGIDPDREAQGAEIAAPTENGSPPVEMDEGTLQRALAEEEAATIVRYERLAKDLESEPRDGVWATEIERAYRDQVEMFEGLVQGAKPSIVSLECRTSLCRMELAFSKEEDAQQYGARLSQHPSIKRGTYRHINTDGEVRTVAFLARGDRTIYPLQPNAALLTEH
jgi:hypothetical protein